ncbi:MAG TPA: hypothetical protein PL151_05190 [Phycisphaerae bacterium]|nr:hypothetical protein [Phycisphaerae bacterium]HOM51961.1 hypothetical protein [Phycisphaerae bacterium]HOQ85650.1 hypothetical protein [Phycisphaerae bacterium]HPP27415.1 hypothetical protein [Phycisphaerae bacterium]HPU25697.1 hypothetical protein [Phycisphaerae bacterium]
MAGQSPAYLTSEQFDSPTFGARMAAGGAVLVVLAATLLQISRIGGLQRESIASFAYTQDEAYEQLVIGRELAGVAGSRSERFGDATPLTASASPGWSLLMAVLLGLRVLSPEAGRSLDEIALVPLVVNLGAAAVLLMLAGHLVRREIRSGLWMFVILVGMALLIPVPPLALTGMEHLAHAVLLLAAVGAGLRAADYEKASVGRTLLATVLIFLSVSLRYESLAALLGLVLWGWIQRRSGRQVWPLAAGIAAVAAVSLHLVRHGGSVLPNPVLVHLGTVFEGGWRNWPTSVLEHAIENLSRVRVPWMLLIVGTVLLAGWRGRTHSPDVFERRRVGWLFVFVVAATCHLLVGPTDTESFRHVAYLIPLGVVAIAQAAAAGTVEDRGRSVQPAGEGVTADERSAVTAAPQPWRRGAGLIAVAALVSMGLVALPAIDAFFDASQAARDAYIRNRLTASFVRTYYGESAVASNEVGTLNYETRARVVDLSGQANQAVALARLHGTYTADAVSEMVDAAGAPVALLLGDAGEVPVPQNWKLLGGWHRAGADRRSASAVQLYSVSPDLETDARMILRLFSEGQRRGIEFWFVEDDALPGTRPEALQVDGARETNDRERHEGA